MTELGIGSARFVYESTSGRPGDLNRLEVYIRQGLTTAYPGLRNGNLAMAIYDENDELVRTVILGNPSEEMRKLMDYEFGTDDPPEAAAG